MYSYLKDMIIYVVSCVLAAGGFLASVTVSLLTIVIPGLQPKVTEQTYAGHRKRIQPRASRELLEQKPLSNSSRAGSSDDSLTSSETVPSELRSEHSSARRTTSTPPTSLPNSPEYCLQQLPPSFGDPDIKCQQAHSPVAQHVCTPQKCANHASTSAAVSSSVVEEDAGKFVKKGGKEGEMKNAKSARPSRVVSWLKTSSPPSLLQSQRTPRSSDEFTPEPVIDELRSSTFVDDAFERRAKRREPRRAATLLPFMRFSKSNRYGPETASARVSELPMPHQVGPVLKGRKSEPTSPSLPLHDLPGVSSDVERIARERKRQISYFGRFKKRDTGKDLTKGSPLRRERGREPVVPPGQLLSPHSPTFSTIGEPERSQEKCPFTRKKSGSWKRRRPGSAPAPPPPRTNPYDAPYYFPTPVSPEAVDYVQRARTGIRQSSVSPSRKGRMLRFDENSVPPELQPSSPVSVQRAKTISSLGARSSSPLLRSTPAEENSIVMSTVRHRKTASEAATALRVDEFGFVHPVTLNNSRSRGKNERTIRATTS